MSTETAPPQKFVQTYHKSQIVCSEATPGKEMYIIHSGKVNLYSQQPSGRRKLLAVLGAGEFFGEMALVDNSPRSATAIADRDNTELIVLDQAKFTYLIRQQPDFALVVMGKLCHRLREANKALTASKTRRETSNGKKKKPTADR